MPKVTCPECSAPMKLRETKKFTYPKSGEPRKFYGCTNWPDCEGTHGAHPDGTPLGVPANKSTKAARMRAHDAFEAWCMKYDYEKGEGYRRLAEMLGVESHNAHIAQLDEEGCEAVIGLCSQGHTV